MNTLVIVPTRRCNLRCPHCHMVRSGGRMSLEVATRAVDLAMTESPGPLRIRFLGGEPLLAFGLVRQVIEYTRSRSAGRNTPPVFDITPNGLRLDEKKRDFFRQHPELELILSCYGDEIDALQASARMPNVSLNMVVFGANVRTFAQRFQRLLDMGFRRFNFLPAYYVRWSQPKLTRLEEQFDHVRQMILADPAIVVKNMAVNSRVPLFNDALTVDCNGDVFLNNMFLFRPFSSLRATLAVGHIDGTVDYRPRNIDYPAVVRQHLRRDVYDSTSAVDRILDRFVHELMSHGHSPLRHRYPEL